MEERATSYVLGEKIFPSEQYEFWFSATKKTLSSNAMLKNICAMLNAQIPTTIYLGISEYGIVVGMELTREDRDEIRLLWDNQVTSRFEPQLLFNNATISFVNVFKRVKDGSKIRTRDTFVIKMNICPFVNQFYMLRSGECYIRKYNAPFPMTSAEVRELAIKREMNSHGEEIQNLWTEIKKLSRSKNDCYPIFTE